MTETGIALVGPMPKSIEWRQLDRFALAYFSTRRDGRNGWMQLTLGAGARRIKLDSTLDGFEDVVCRGVAAASESGAQLTSATRRNLQEMKLPPGLLPADMAAGGEAGPVTDEAQRR